MNLGLEVPKDVAQRLRGYPGGEFSDWYPRNRGLEFPDVEQRWFPVERATEAVKGFLLSEELKPTAGDEWFSDVRTRSSEATAQGAEGLFEFVRNLGRTLDRAAEIGDRNPRFAESVHGDLPYAATMTVPDLRVLGDLTEARRGIDTDGS